MRPVCSKENTVSQLLNSSTIVPQERTLKPQAKSWTPCGRFLIVGPLTDGLVAFNGRVALGIDFDLGALPGAVKVCLDGHVCGCGVK